MDDSVSLISVQEFKVANRAMLPSPYATFCGALHSGCGLMMAIRSDEFEFGNLHLDEKTRFWRVVAHEIRVRGAVADVRSFTFVNMHLVSDFADKVSYQRRVVELLDTLPPPPCFSRVTSTEWPQGIERAKASCRC